MLEDRTMVSVDASSLQGWFVPFDNTLVSTPLSWLLCAGDTRIMSSHSCVHVSKKEIGGCRFDIGLGGVGYICGELMSKSCSASPRHVLVTMLDGRTMVSVDASSLQGWFVPFDYTLVSKPLSWLLCAGDTRIMSSTGLVQGLFAS